MNGVTHLITSLNLLFLGEGFAINTNLLDTNLINLALVIGVLVYFGKGVCANWYFNYIAGNKPAILWVKKCIIPSTDLEINLSTYLI